MPSESCSFWYLAPSGIRPGCLEARSSPAGGKARDPAAYHLLRVDLPFWEAASQDLFAIPELLLHSSPEGLEMNLAGACSLSIASKSSSCWSSLAHWLSAHLQKWPLDFSIGVAMAPCLSVVTRHNQTYGAASSSESDNRMFIFPQKSRPELLRSQADNHVD